LKSVGQDGGPDTSTRTLDHFSALRAHIILAKLMTDSGLIQ